eukprot:tig00000767_g3952.t1
MAGAAGDAAADVRPAESRLRIDAFEERIGETSLHFQIAHLTDSFFVWVGTSPPKLQNLDVSFPIKFDSIPAATTLLAANGHDDTGKSLAQRLAKRFDKPFFVSCNLPSDEPMLGGLVERALVTRLRAAS